jgi:hypothetical protein
VHLYESQPRANPRHLCFKRSRTVRAQHQKETFHQRKLSYSAILTFPSVQRTLIFKMFSRLTTKIALRKAGIPSNALDYSTYETKSSNPKDQNAALPFANPFANLEVPKSWKSWATPPPPPLEVAAPPELGTKAPTSAKLRLPVGGGRSTVVVFLRHCGCPCMSFPLSSVSLAC